MKPLRIIWVGNAHSHAALNMQAVKAHPEAFTVVGVSDLNEEKDKDTYEGFARIPFEEALKRSDVDAFIIEAGKENEVYYGIRCAEAGFPIFMDKPGSENLAEYKKLLDIIGEKNLPFALGYMFRHNENILKAEQLVKDGELGDVYSIEAQMSVRHPKERREPLKIYKGGMMYFLGCHLIDVICTVQGFPDEVLPFNYSTGTEGVNLDDCGLALLRYGNKYSEVKTSAVEYNGYIRRRIVICGTEGTIEIAPLEFTSEPGKKQTGVHSTLKKDAPNPWKDCSKEWPHESFDRYYPMLLQFAQQVREGAPRLRSLEYEYKLMETIIRACGCRNSVTDER